MVDSAPAVSTHKSRFRGFPPFPKVDVATVKPSRDLALDFVRSWSLLVVVFGHFIMLIVHWSPDNIPTTSNTLSSGNLWPFATWVLQVMPLFFIAGGAVNQASWNRFSGTYSQWVWQRVNRLMRPTVVYLLTLAVIFTIVTFAVPRAITDPWVTGITGPLWFLAVYIPVTALTPWTSRLYKANPVASLVIPLILVVGFDVLRFHLGESMGVPNLIVAWVLVHQLGYVYNSGIKQRFAVAFIVVGLGANIVLTQLTHIYPTSLVGIPTEKF